VDKRCRIVVRLRPHGAAFEAKSATEGLRRHRPGGRSSGRGGAPKIAWLQERRPDLDDRGRSGDRLALLVIEHGEEG
jgi:hypothetical protein